MDSVLPDKYGYYDILTMIDDNPDGASIEIKDRRGGIWKDDLFKSRHRGYCNYIVELMENSDIGIVESYYCKSQIHALKVYKTICEKRDFDWALNYLTELADSADRNIKKGSN